MYPLGYMNPRLGPLFLELFIFVLFTVGTLIPGTSLQTLTTVLMQKDNQVGDNSSSTTAGSSKPQTITRPASREHW